MWLGVGKSKHLPTLTSPVEGRKRLFVEVLKSLTISFLSKGDFWKSKMGPDETNNF
jgi:hypothetical protein